LFARAVLEKGLPEDADFLKIEVPERATPETPWKMTRQSRHRYYRPYLIREGGWDERGFISARVKVQQHEVEPDSDVYALVYEQLVAVTPMSVDLTARVDLAALTARLKS
jgi:5'-nucleotidase